MFDLSSLASQFGGTIWVLAFFILALSIIVTVHEYGHYIIGRLCGIHADVFSLGFGPVLVSRYDRRGTKWQIAALPLGGYVRFRGDENAASASVSPDAKDPTTLQGAPLWARSATVAAGPVFNFIFSILLFTVLFITQGQVTDRLIVEELHPLPIPHDLQAGDEVLAIHGQKLGQVETLPDLALIDYTVLRDGDQITVQGPHFNAPRIASVRPQSAAFDAGIKVDEVVTAINGTPVIRFEQLQDHVAAHQGAEMTLTLWKDGEMRDVTLTPQEMDIPKEGGGFEKRWLIGITFGLFFEPARERLDLWPAIQDAVKQTYNIIAMTFSGVYHMIKGAISTCNMSGPVTIAQTSGQMAEQGAVPFLFFIAAISTAIGLMNLLPVPVLDGGHLVFYAYEAIRGRPPSEKAMRLMFSIGLSVILGVMIFALSNDLFC